MGTRLMEDYAAKNTIETLVNSGDIDDELATAWKQKLAEKLAEKLADETKVKEMRAKAEGGDGDAMYWLGTWHRRGTNGLAKDEVQARAWDERSAATRHPKGMGTFGESLLLGLGGSKETSLGLVNVTEAAGLGSNVAAFRLGKAFFNGAYGLPKDPARARYWLKKVVDGECAHKHLSNEASLAEAARWLRELDGGAALQADAAALQAEVARDAALQAERAARNDALYARLQRQHEEHQRRQPEATAPRE